MNYYVHLKQIFTRCTHLQCMLSTCISITFEPTCVHYCQLVGVAHAFRTVGHVQLTCVSSVRRMAKCTLKEFGEVSEVLNTLPKARYGRFSRWPHVHVCLLRKPLLLSFVIIDLATDFMGQWLHFGSLSSLLLLGQSPSSFFFFTHALSSQFSAILMSQ